MSVVEIVFIHRSHGRGRIPRAFPWEKNKKHALHNIDAIILQQINSKLSLTSKECRDKQHETW